METEEKRFNARMPAQLHTWLKMKGKSTGLGMSAYVIHLIQREREIEERLQLHKWQEDRAERIE